MSALSGRVTSSLSLHSFRRYSSLANFVAKQSTLAGTNKAERPIDSHRNRCCSFSTDRLRRLRRYRRPEIQPAPKRNDFGKLELPYEHGEVNLEAYLKKTSLSPWVPLPDVVARKVFDLSQAGPEDRHVDLGSGDGRVCFHALRYNVASSVGIDVDEAIVDVAKQRLAKRHPAPPNLKFIVADLLDSSHPVWEQYVQPASLITMYFATEALERFRPLLEKKMAGRQCKIVTCGYEMPGWKAAMHEVVLGTQIHLYLWGSELQVDGDDDFLFSGPDILDEKPKELLENALESNKYGGFKIIDKTGRHPIRGFNPAIFEEEEDDEEDWDVYQGSDDESGKK